MTQIESGKSKRAIMAVDTDAIREKIREKQEPSEGGCGTCYDIQHGRYGKNIASAKEIKHIMQASARLEEKKKAVANAFRCNGG